MDVLNKMKCYYVGLVSNYSKKILHAYKCDIEEDLFKITEAKRYIKLEENKIECILSTVTMNELKRFKTNLNTNYSDYCRGC